MRMTSAVPASPECSAMKPASRPITSITITRSWLSAVVCSLSIASSAVLTAVSKPNVVIVPLDVVVDRLRHADDLHALVAEALGDRQRAVAADRDHRVDAERLRAGDQLVGAVLFDRTSRRRRFRG